MTRPDDRKLRDADRRAREEAQLRFDRPLVLEAGAGTGKTAVLVARIVVWCLGPGWERAEARLAGRSGPAAPARAEQVAAEVLRGVVAITFTEAAAAEMASRVAEALLDLRGGGLPQGFLERALPPPLMRHPRIEALVGALDQLAVRTIHAACRRWLAAHAVDAGLRPGFEVDADGQQQAEAAREALEALLPRAFGESFDPDFGVLTDAGLGPRDVEEALITLLAEGAAPDDLAGEPITPDALATLAARLRDAVDRFLAVEAGRLAGLGGKAPAVTRTMERLLATRAALEGDPPGDAEGWQPLRQALAALWPGAPKDMGRLIAWAKGDFPARAELGDDAEALQGLAAPLLHGLRHVLRFDPVLLGAARRVLHELLADAHERLQDRGALTFGGLLRGARDLLDARPDVAARLRGEIDQLLVDEFQDTDALQCEILERLALEGDEGERPGLFLVGDPKQSIYGWRGADLRAYQGFVARARAAEGEVLPLVVNFRSTAAVLDEVERLIEPVMQEAPGFQPAFQRLLPREGERPEDLPTPFRPVEHWISWPAGDDGVPDPGRPKREASELEARRVAADLQRLRAAGVSPGDVALLLRSTGDFDVYLGALREAGIPYVVEREEQHGRRREVVDALAWLRCLLDPNDALALVATLRSSLVGVPDAALVPLWRRKLPERVARLRGAPADEIETLCREVREVAKALPPEVPGLERIAGWEEGLVAFLRELGPLRALAEEGPVDRFVEALRGPFGLEAAEAGRHLGAHRLASLDRVFRELALALESTGGSAAAVLSYLRRAGGPDREHREGRRRAFHEDAVHVMTVHKAKGLGFRHVYLLQSHKGEARDAARRTTWVHRGGRSEYVLFGAATPGMLSLEEERAEVEASERVRLLYVAATRAKQRLVIAGKRPARPRNAAPTSFSDLLGRRRRAPADLAAALAEATAEGRTHDGDGVMWGFPALWPPPEPLPAESGTAALLSAAEVLAGEERLEAAREAAREREGRPFRDTASSRHAPLDDEGGSVGARDPRARARAMEVGNAVHAWLEELALETPPDTWPPGLEAALDDQGLDPESRARAAQLAERFVGSPLAARLHGLAGRLIGREVPLLLAPEEGRDPSVGCVVGNIDLLYRDEDGEVVVADYKTDAVRGADALAARSQAYAGQGQVYVRAVQAALGLAEPPRFELWFLDAGRIVTPGP